MRFPIVAIVLLLAVVACGGGSASPAADGTGIEGVAVAGPVCPVERPGDPACAPRPVVGAGVVVRDAEGNEAATTTTDREGRFEVGLPPGRYTVEALPVEGLMGNPAPIDVEVREGLATVDLTYDTGIR